MQDPSKLLDKIKSVLIVDLLDHAMNLNVELQSSLLEPPLGLYVKGSPIPILKEGKQYYPRSRYLDNKAKIRDFSTVLDMTEDVVDEHGEVVLSAVRLSRIGKYLTLVPDVPIVAIEVAKVMAIDYLCHICPHARIVNNVYLENLVKPEHRHLMQGGEFEEAFEKLLSYIFEWVDEDNWFIYFIEIKGSNMIIKKVIDYRIYRYHELEYLEWQKVNSEEYEHEMLNDTSGRIHRFNTL